MSSPSADDRTRRLLDVGRALPTELDPQAVLHLILEQARAITGARYAALGVLNEQRTELDRFVTSGMVDATRRSIGDLPRGRGVLGVPVMIRGQAWAISTSPRRQRESSLTPTRTLPGSWPAGRRPHRERQALPGLRASSA